MNAYMMRRRETKINKCHKTIILKTFKARKKSNNHSCYLTGKL